MFRGDWLFAVMIGFFYLYTWFWALGLFYRISLDAEGMVILKSFRRRLEVYAKEIHAVEGSRFSGGFGFVRLKLPRESVYLFCHRRDEALDEISRGISGRRIPWRGPSGYNLRVRQGWSAPRSNVRRVSMTQMFTIPHNILLVFGLGIVLAVIGFVVVRLRQGLEERDAGISSKKR